MRLVGLVNCPEDHIGVFRAILPALYIFRSVCDFFVPNLFLNVVTRLSDLSTHLHPRHGAASTATHTPAPALAGEARLGAAVLFYPRSEQICFYWCHRKSGAPGVVICFFLVDFEQELKSRGLIFPAFTRCGSRVIFRRS